MFWRVLGRRAEVVRFEPRRSTREHVLFVGFALSQQLFERLLTTDNGMPIQTQRFGWSVIHALQQAGLDLTAVSAEPALDFPNNSRVFFRRATFHELGVRGLVIPFVNVTGVKHVSRYVSSLIAIYRSALRVHPSALIVHGVHSPFIWAAVRVGRRCDIPVVVIMTDAPSQRTPFDTRISWWLKRADRLLILAGLQRADGVIALTRALAEDFAPGRPYLLMEGIARPLPLIDRAHPGSRAEAGRRRVVYAGGLREEYGVMELVRSVALSERDWTLRIYGRGPLQPAIEAAAVSERRVEFGGLADTGELAGIYAQADLLVNPRPIHQEFTRYSFPSKVLEYMASGRPVLTTSLPEIPEDYAPHLNFVEADAASIARAIDDLLTDSQESLDETGAAAKQFVIKTRGPAAQGARMRQFVHETIERHRKIR